MLLLGFVILLYFKVDFFVFKIIRFRRVFDIVFFGY